MKRWVPITICALALPVFAVEKKDIADRTCTEKYSTGQYEIAAPICIESAKAGDAASQTALGLMYFYGQGVAPDPTLAAQWFTEAAKQNDAQAQYELARLYSTGLGIPLNEKAAMAWYKKSAEQGHWKAQFALSLGYRLGIGVPKDLKAAFLWYEKAQKAQPLGVPARTFDDFILQQSKIDNSLPGANLYLKGVTIQTGEQGDPDPANALSWFLESADQGNPNAEFNLGLMYFEGDGVEQNYDTAFEWFTKAQEHDQKDAIAYLAWMNLLGLGTSFNLKEAFLLYADSLSRVDPPSSVASIGPTDFQMTMKEAIKGDAKAQYKVGLKYFEGTEVKQDYLEAFRWLYSAAKMNQPDAQFVLGNMLLEGHGVIRDSKAGVDWLIKSANQNNPNAQFELGVLYSTGRFVPKDLIQAYMWLNLAAAQDITEAQPARANVSTMLSPEQMREAEKRSQDMFQKFSSPKGS